MFFEESRGFWDFEAGKSCGDVGTQNNPQDKQICCFGLGEWSLIFCGLQAQLIRRAARLRVEPICT